ncbi:atpH [Wigglesworthia glossinidia endosymbiont of Glossina brevipalpis]|uniref:ATP synthase subunit delta n=1 Tax=Wigglesworthia glossinidia brevipalpis TaxID=36870 RepID=ATPD_WIGBR|nr:RecName: Full=ATP synthase subunit delta; AltName: Full=ATP synthase F(1) sector subunit delta; AltName: Full=F-type ATPase subunit delta; Short=F-ATPase subunit delta [Wigglesworthia glossinidia endosymbiont of Glossina brevipalpis]BAC24151.1 atpH [Wigglesworthia glossinidia endosymbiont of Glossina brevipalpis]
MTIYEIKSYLSRPYAEAAFKFANENNIVDDWIYMIEEICKILKNIKIYSLSSFILKKNKNFLFESIKNNFDVYFNNFVKIIIENNRLIIFPEILNQFINLKNDQNNIENITIISKYKLDKKILNKIEKKIKSLIFKEIKINIKIDKSIIGGYIIKSKNFLIDNSIKNKLYRFSEYL